MLLEWFQFAHFIVAYHEAKIHTYIHSCAENFQKRKNSSDIFDLTNENIKIFQSKKSEALGLEGQKVKTLVESKNPKNSSLKKFRSPQTFEW